MKRPPDSGPGGMPPSLEALGDFGRGSDAPGSSEDDEGRVVVADLPGGEVGGLPVAEGREDGGVDHGSTLTQRSRSLHSAEDFDDDAEDLQGEGQGHDGDGRTVEDVGETDASHGSVLLTFEEVVALGHLGHVGLTHPVETHLDEGARIDGTFVHHVEEFACDFAGDSLVAHGTSFHSSGVMPRFAARFVRSASR